MPPLSVLPFLCLALSVSLAAAGPPKSGPSRYYPEDRGTRSWLLSTGDSLAVAEMFPVDTPQQVEQVFANIDDLFNIHRIIWRGAQSDRLAPEGGYLVRFDDSFRKGLFDLFTRFSQNKISEAAAKAAKARGLEFWGMDSLTEMHNLPWVDAGKGFGSSVGVARHLYEHPEFIPTDRIGLRKQGGMMSYAYPEARAAVVRSFDEFLTAHPYYDGIWLYTFVENFDQQFEDEFGFEPPLVEEYRKRYGVDLRTAPFDKQKWYDLKGEYFTQFLRELRAVFNKHGKKLAVTLDPTRLDRPVPWLAGGAQLRPTGRFTIEWKKWIDEGLVDELNLYCVGGEDVYFNAWRQVSTAIGERPIRLSVYNSAPLPERWGGAVDRVMQDVPWQHRGYPGKRPLSELGSADPYAKLNVLYQLQAGEGATYTQMLNERVEPPAETPAKVDGAFLLKHVVPLLKDPHVLVRRQAVNALAASGDPQFLPYLEDRLLNDENTVQALAMRALGKMNGPNSVAAIREAVAKNPNWMLAEEAIKAFGKFGPERLQERLAGCKDADPHVRYVFCFGFSRSPASPEAEAVLLEALKDPDETVRYAAAFALTNFRSDAVKAALLGVVRNDNLYVAQRAAVTLGNHYATLGNYSGPEQREIAAALEPLFEKFRTGETFRGSQWAWRPIGNTLYQMGPAGRNALRRILLNGKDPYLADRAWEVLYTRVDGWGWRPLAEEAVLANYPFAQGRPGATVPPPFPDDAEAAEIVFVEQDFDALAPGSESRAGDYRQPPGMWLNLGKAPNPTVQALHARGGNAVEIVRAAPGKPSTLEARRMDLTLTDQQVALSAWVRLPHAGAKLFIGMRPARGDSAGVTIDGSGKLTCITGSGKLPAVDTGAVVESWFRIGIDYDLRNRTMRVRTGKDLEQTLAKDVALPEGQSFVAFIASPQGLLNTKAQMDDIRVTFRE